jgi:hypothetical protein
LALAEHDDGRLRGLGRPGGGLDLETEGRELRRGPAGGIAAWRFAHDQPATCPQERRTAFRHDRGRTERPGDNEIELAAPLLLARRILGLGVDNRDPVGKVEHADRIFEKGGPPSSGLEEDPARRWPPDRQRQARHPAARAEIERRLGWRDRLSEPGRMAEMVIDGTRPQEPQLLGSPPLGEYRVDLLHAQISW